MQYLIFKVNCNLYALDIRVVDEITEPKKLLDTQLTSDKLVQGIIYIREKCYPCINLAKFLSGFKEKDSCRYILTTYRDTQVCYIVDEIIGIKDFSSTPIRNAIGVDYNLFSGILHDTDSLILIWNMDYPLSTPEFN